jgi:hypothetical protein
LNRRKGQEKAPGKTGAQPVPGEKQEPDWAEGLREFYNSVLEEPLPDSFDKLLKRLDESDRE